MFNSKLFTTLMVLLIVLIAGSAMAGAKLTVNDDSYIDLGYRLQTYWQQFDDGDNTATDFRLRRARFRLKGAVNEKVTVFMQTDVATKDMKMIDAHVTYKASPWFQFVMGRNMAPSSRQATTGSGGLMAMDRPYQVGHALNWGANGGVSGGTIPVTPDAVRDNGLTLFGSNALGDGNLKYYLGVYNGVQHGDAVDDKDHYAFRAQYNLWDAEKGYFNSSTYLGQKKTLGVGFSFDQQAEVGSSAAPVGGDPDVLVDYSLMSFDVFLELPSSNGNALTAEFAYNMLDFDDTVDFMTRQGNGYYFQAGYYLSSGFQPWFEYEAFTSDATEAANGATSGDSTSYRIGATYYIDGQHANIKLGYEARKWEMGGAVGDSDEDTLDTITLGFFTNY